MYLPMLRLLRSRQLREYKQQSEQSLLQVLLPMLVAAA